MKRLTTSLALLAFLVAGSAMAAETPPAEKRPPQKQGRMDGKGDKPRLRFEDCDKDKDGALSLEEFLACYPRGGKERFEAMDANKDGKLTHEEMRAYRDARMAEKRRAFFDKCDKNKDGMLSFEEFEQCRPAHGPGGKGQHARDGRGPKGKGQHGSADKSAGKHHRQARSA